MIETRARSGEQSDKRRGQLEFGSLPVAQRPPADSGRYPLGWLRSKVAPQVMASHRGVDPDRLSGAGLSWVRPAPRNTPGGHPIIAVAT